MNIIDLLVDDLTYRQLKESEHAIPELTDFIYDSNRMLEMGLDAIEFAQLGFDIVWDRVMFNFIWKYFREGIQLAEEKGKQKGIRFRLIVEVTDDNIDDISSIKYHQIKHLENLRGNFAIVDKRSYVMQIFHSEKDKPDQSLFSNSSVLVSKQQSLFDKLWEIAIPIEQRRKDLKSIDLPIYQKTFNKEIEIYQEIDSLFKQCKKEILIFWSKSVYDNLFSNYDFFKKLMELQNSQVVIKMLADNVNNILSDYTSKFEFKGNPIQIRHSYKLGSFEEIILLIDGVHVLHLKIDETDRLVATYSNEEHMVLVQELLFEKYWNELESLRL